ncbi:SAM-dependent methyltransferase [Chlorella sorokiniana]|jgi:SAM-dependent methyltransferase|uniref:SAM-dependent methyltransferase n=1 Tax=Chlorella sorokiniana TaxID=3076 RepID=A0A2P6TK56_CHLSO|nr:SAM-dependent methyltransferase [Chlorella sorokiniana]|eukprot:PRW44457.1 SAM-dependent methyltransferase [Chlorella sorokiniana]
MEAPWEIGRAQAAVVNLVYDGTFDGCSVLDVGCGIGDNSLYIARHARKAIVTACDLVERALDVVRHKAAGTGLPLECVQQDLLTPLQGELQGRQFDVVLDANVYHCFSPGPDRDAYVANLARLVRLGGRLVMLVFSDKQGGSRGPVRVSQADIRASFGPPGWEVESIEDAVTESNPIDLVGDGETLQTEVPAYLAHVLRKAG